jgi:hypothetical protein
MKSPSVSVIRRSCSRVFPRGCDLDALLALHDVTKLFMLRARECCLLNSKTHDYAFHDFKQLLSQASAVGSMRMSEASIHAVLVTVARGI